MFYAAIRLDRDTWSRSFAALPRNREIDPREQLTALEMKRLREHLARDIGRQLAAKLLEIIEKKDPQFGYSAEEWERMQRLASNFKEQP
jgi:hypothetical protein